MVVFRPEPVMLQSKEAHDLMFHMIKSKAAGLAGYAEAMNGLVEHFKDREQGLERFLAQLSAMGLRITGDKTDEQRTVTRAHPTGTGPDR